MNTEDLKVFMKAYEYKNYSKTADDFFITPQGVSKIIHRLEAELDCTLFERTGRSVFPTSQAHTLALYTARILENVHTLEAAVHNPFYIEKTTLKAAFTTGLLSYLSPLYRTSFLNAHPEISLELSEYNDSETDAILRSDRAEIGFQSEPIDFTFYDAIPFSCHELVTIVNSKHPLASRNSVSFKDFHDETLCILGPQYFSYNQYLNELMNAGAVPKDIYTVKDTSSMQSYAHTSPVIGITLGFVADKLEDSGIVSIPFEPRRYWHTYIIWKKNRTLTPGAEAFIQHSLDWVRKHRL